MEKQIITFSANEQKLQKTGGIDCYASNTVAYIEAHFDLEENWSGFDSVWAVWWNDYNKTVTTPLDSQGVCKVPAEVVARKSIVRVNLVGSTTADDVISDRLTTCPIEAVTIKCNARVTGDETVPITPSQFEQFVAQVISEVEKVTGMTAEAETLPSGSQATASYSNGVLHLGIPQGAQGEQGESGVGIASVVLNVDYTLTITMTDGTSITTTSIRGEKGEKGADGITPSISIGNVETLEPNEDAYVTRRGTDAEPIFDFGIPKGNKGEDAVIPWDSILPVDTASGEIVTIPDGSDLVPAKSLKVALEPIQEGSGTPSPTNVRPISGHTEVNTQRTGINVWDEEWEEGTINTNGDNSSSTTRWRTKNYISIKPNTQYYFKGTKTGSGTASIRPRFYDANKVYIGNTSQSGTDIVANTVFTTPTNAYYMRFTPDKSGTYGILTDEATINYPSTDTEYHPYNGTTYTTSLGQTVYGGTLDVVSGELTVDRAMVDLGTLPWVRNNTAQVFWTSIPDMKRPCELVCSQYAYQPNGNIEELQNGEIWNRGYAYAPNNIVIKDLAYTDATAFKTAMNGVQLCYELANPQTYQLSPQTIALLQGTNNVWGSGDVTLTYNADIQLWVLKQLS